MARPLGAALVTNTPHSPRRAAGPLRREHLETIPMAGIARVTRGRWART